MMEAEVGQPTAEEVISRLKDDGDFDTLRVKIIRKLKENKNWRPSPIFFSTMETTFYIMSEELRNSILAEVKQSAILNRDGAENLKPRQLSDAINQEIGNKIMGKISDEVWKVIRSNDGMKDEIRETVESVYKKIVNPKVPEANDYTTPGDQHISAKDHDALPTASTGETTTLCELSEPPGFATSSIGETTTLCDNERNESPGFATESTSETTTLCDNEPSEPPGFATASVGETTTLCDNEPSEPPGFALCDRKQVVNDGKEDQKELLHNQQPCKESKPELHGPTDMLLPIPDFSESVRNADMPCEGSDDDPDVPPGFG